jgi:hypothetical protein
MATVHDCRFLIQLQNDHKKVCRMVFGKKDASLYLIPYGRQQRYLWGEGTVPEGSTTATFSHANPVGDLKTAKLSIHQSGQVHVKTVEGDVYVAGPLGTKPLWEFRGEHLAGLTVDHLDSLPDAGKVKGKPKSPELVLRSQDLEHTRRFAIYANGAEPRFDFPVKATITMNRVGLPAPLHIGITSFAQEPLATGEEGGVTIICGWNPDKEEVAEQRILWVRAI